MTHYTIDIDLLKQEVSRHTGEISSLRREVMALKAENARLEKAFVELADTLARHLAQFTETHELILEIADMHIDELAAKRRVDTSAPNKIG
jgi:cell division protein FtsB